MTEGSAAVTQALLRCPFCGGEAERFTAKSWPGFEMRQIRCRCCGADAFDKKWQRRAALASRPADREGEVANDDGPIGLHLDADMDRDGLYGRSTLKNVEIAEMLAERRSMKAVLSTHPDIGPISRGHICKHGVRWPHACAPCDDAAASAPASRTNTMPDSLEDLAGRLTHKQRWAIRHCGDVADRFPCKACGTASLPTCPISAADGRAAATACNDAGAVVNGSGFTALRTYLAAPKDQSQ